MRFRFIGFVLVATDPETFAFGVFTSRLKRLWIFQLDALETVAVMHLATDPAKDGYAR